MRTIGVITTAAIGVLALLGLRIAVKSVPDVQRYLRLRSM